jgi:serine/threonine-protein kinase
LGECYKQAGRTASAWAIFREAASKADAAGESDRARTGKKRADELEGTLSRVTFEVAEENEAIEDLVVRQGDRPVNRALWGTAIPVDPGQLKVVAEAPGYETWETTVLIGEGGSGATLTVPPLVKLPEEVAPPPEEPAPVVGETQTTVTPLDVKKPGSTQKTVGLVLAGIGVVGVGVGGAFGILAMQSESDAGEFCKGATCEPETDGIALTNKARDRALISTIGFAAGGALLAGGLTLYFTAPKKQEVAALELAPLAGGGHFSYKASF